ncbi:14933_t:CDS:1, partial [Racocetra persica]
ISQISNNIYVTFAFTVSKWLSVQNIVSMEKLVRASSTFNIFDRHLRLSAENYLTTFRREFV